MKVREILAEIRQNIEAERVSWGEIAYLQAHVKAVRQYGDIVLMEWAGIPER